MKLEFLGSTSNVLATRERPSMEIDQLRSDLNAFLFPFRTEVYAVRVTTDDGRKILIRRPKYEGQRPRVRVMSLQEVAAETASQLCEGCDKFLDVHSRKQHELRVAVAARFPRQKNRRAV